jgi:hypothetical protein
VRGLGAKLLLPKSSYKHFNTYFYYQRIKPPPERSQAQQQQQQQQQKKYKKELKILLLSSIWAFTPCPNNFAF